jgi:hypothetical protein
MQSIVLGYIILFGLYFCIEAEVDIFYSFLKFANSTNFSPNLLALLRDYHKSNVAYSMMTTTIDVSKSAKVERLIFLKTHKTGGSTLNRILWRSFCTYNGFNCFLPPAENAGKIWNLDKIEGKVSISFIFLSSSHLLPIDYNYITENGGSQFNRTMPLNVWLHHVYYNDKLLSRIIINPDFIVTITRNPVQRFVSAWDWYEHEEELSISLPKFIQLHDSSKSCKVEPFHCQRFKYRTGLDSVAAELVTELNVSNYYKLLSSIMRRQLLVLVTDRFDESLLILAKFLNLNLENILYFSQKVSKNHGVNYLTGHDVDKLYKIQPYDTGLYVTANYMLDQYMKEYGIDRMNRDLMIFQRAQKRLLQICHFNKTLSAMQNNTLWKAFCADLNRDNRDAISYVWEKRQNSNVFKGIDLNVLFV